MDDGSTPLGDLRVAVVDAAKRLEEEVGDTTFAGLPPGGRRPGGALFPKALTLSGSDSLAMGPPESGASLTLGASSSFQVFALSGDFADPDGVVKPGAGAAWLKHELGAEVSTAMIGSTAGAAGTGTGLALGLEGGATARLLDYRRHAGADVVATAALAEMARPRLSRARPSSPGCRTTAGRSRRSRRSTRSSSAASTSPRGRRRTPTGRSTASTRSGSPRARPRA